MASVVQGVIEVCKLISQPPVVVGGLAVLSRLSNPYLATVDLDLVDRLRGELFALPANRAPICSTSCASSSTKRPGRLR